MCMNTYNILLFFRPWAQNVSMSHDAYFCKKYPGLIYPFPSQRVTGVGNFIGAVMTNNNSITGELPLKKDFECPKECRPSNHIDWLYC